MADIKPPFTLESARKKVKAAQAAWNTRDPHTCVKAYSTDSIWRNRSTFLRGHPAIVSFLAAKWRRELDYRLRKELFAFSADKIAVQFWYEYRIAAGMEKAEKEGADGGEVWRRAYGLEDWTFDADGKMRKRMMSCNEVEIKRAERWFVGEVEVGESVDALVEKAVIGEEHW